MILYHNSKNRDRLLRKEKFDKPPFDYVRFITEILESIAQNKTTGIIHINENYRQTTHPRFLGNGVYCYDNYPNAVEFSSTGKVVLITYEDEKTILLDLDNPLVMDEIRETLENQAEDKIKLLFQKDPDTLARVLLLVELIKTFIYEDFEQFEPGVGILLFVLYEYLKMPKDDIVSKTFFNMVNSRHEKYYLLQNYSRDKVKCISIPIEEEGEVNG